MIGAAIDHDPADLVHPIGLTPEALARARRERTITTKRARPLTAPRPAWLVLTAGVLLGLAAMALVLALPTPSTSPASGSPPNAESVRASTSSTRAGASSASGAAVVETTSPSRSAGSVRASLTDGWVGGAASAGTGTPLAAVAPAGSVADTERAPAGSGTGKDGAPAGSGSGKDRAPAGRDGTVRGRSVAAAVGPAARPVSAEALARLYMQVGVELRALQREAGRGATDELWARYRRLDLVAVLRGSPVDRAAAMAALERLRSLAVRRGGR